MRIPKILQNKEMNFVLIEKSSKKPFQQAWQNKLIKYDDTELIKHLNSNGNYGVIGGGEKNLIIIDFDNKELQDKLFPILPETFTVKTGSGLLHLYYFSDKSDSFKIFDKELKTLADIQGKGKQVVGAGSVHPNGKKYELIKNIPISFINYAEVKAQLMPYDKKPKKEITKPNNLNIEYENNFVDECKSQIKIQDVLNLIGIDTSKNPTECPFHSSKGGKCLGFQDDVANCFHCDTSWNIFSLIKQWKNCDFKTSLEILADNFGLNDKLEESRQQYKEKIKKETILPSITIPSTGKSISSFAEDISKLLKLKNILFYRPNSNEIVEIGNIKIKDKNNKVKNFIGFIKMEPKRFITLIEKYAKIGVEEYLPKLKAWDFKEKSLSTEKAGITLASQILIDSLPQINRIFTVPLPIICKDELTFPKEGYDPRFNSWLTPDAPKLEKMSLEEAKEILEEIYKEFCFDDPRENTLSMAISALLTPYLRGLFSEFNVRTPIFFYIANQKRAGKDFCAGVTGIIHEGINIQETPINTGERSGNGNEELRKKFTAALIAGRKRLHFSNNKGHINNAVFEGIVTSPTHSDRILGGNEMINLDNEIDFSLSGNSGITYTPDFADRCRFINLFYAGEDANERTFKRPNLHYWVKENRSKILSALYSLVKNWIDTGSKPGSIPFASFHEWSQICGGIMEAAGYINPCITDKANQNLSGDTETQNMKQIFELCYEKYPDEWIKKEKIYDIVKIGEIYSLEEIKHKTIFMIKFRRYIRRVLSNIHLQIDETLKRKADHTFKFTKKGVIITKGEGFITKGEGLRNVRNVHTVPPTPLTFLKEKSIYSSTNVDIPANVAGDINHMTDKERIDYAELNEVGLSDKEFENLKMGEDLQNE